MEIILLEHIPKLGQMGDIVKVKTGYARNFLLPQKKALRANERNKEFFEKQRVQLEARNLEQKSEAEKLAEKLNGQRFVIVRSAGENGHLYGSVSIRDIIESMHEAGVKINRAQIELNQPFKNLGLHELTLNLHPEVQATVTIHIARSKDETEKEIIEFSSTEEIEDTVALA